MNSAASRPLRTFLTVLLGQLISFVGSGLSSFALGIHVYEKSGSIAQFSLTAFSFYLPQLLLSPIAGVFIDRWDRKVAMLVADVGAGLSVLAGFAMVYASEAGYFALENWHLFASIALSASFAAFRAPALQATTALLMPSTHLPRANSLIELAAGTGQIVAPALAGILLTRIHLSGILIADLASFAFSVGTLLLVQLPRPPRSREGRVGMGSLGSELVAGWRFIAQRQALLVLLGFVALSSLILSMVLVLLTPLALSFTDASTLGYLMSTSGTGMMLGAVLMGVWGGPARRMSGVIGFTLLGGIALLAVAMPPNIPLLGAAVFLFLFTVPFVNSCAQTIWQLKVPPDMQGRVFSVRRMVVLASPPIAALTAGTLAEKVFEPWMASKGPLALRIGAITGNGEGRGVALLLAILGAITVVFAIASRVSPKLWRIERDLPDLGAK
jgi:MFS family permease